MQTQEVAVVHDNRCQCNECKEEVKMKFLAFKIAPRQSPLKNQTEHCAECKRPIKPIGRGAFIVWSCWECMSQLASVKKIINHGDENVFGFAEREDGTQIYFHCGRYTEIVFDESDYAVQGPMTTKVPAIDDVIRYQEFDSERGLKALWWTFDDDYEVVKRLIAGRHGYRLLRRTGKVKLSRLQEAPIMQVYWQGKDLTDLRKKFAKNHYSLYSDFDSALTIQAFNEEEGIWYDCEDPR